MLQSVCHWEENISKQIEIFYLLTILLSITLNKLPWSTPRNFVMWHPTHCRLLVLMAVNENISWTKCIQIYVQFWEIMEDFLVIIHLARKLFGLMNFSDYMANPKNWSKKCINMDEIILPWSIFLFKAHMLQRLKDISTLDFSTPSFNPGPFNSRLFNHELFNPGLFNHDFLNNGVEKF